VTKTEECGKKKTDLDYPSVQNNVENEYNE
jgi:hypothetical protein